MNISNKMCNKYWLCLLPIYFLAACSSNQPSEHSKFLTRMSASGLKHFELRHIAAAEPHKQERRRDPAKLYRRAKSAMVEEAEKIIELNQYCREGFWVLNFESSGYSHRLRGECNELASMDDKQKFPDTLKRW